MLHHVLNSSDYSKADLDYIITVANHIAKDHTSYSEVAKGKILATLFFEASTRTRLSFESAMLRLGGGVIGFSDMSASSTSKGETIEDTARTVCCYCDVMCVRHPVAFTPHNMAKVSSVPMLNAGDGANEHPSQTITDLVTIHQRFGRLDHLTIGLCGDLKFGRTVHSLIKMLSRYPGNRFVLIAPDALQMPAEIIAELDKQNAQYTLTDNMEEAIPALDILYMTRIQRERFADPADYARLKGMFILNRDKLKTAKKNMVVLHPLPRVDEIATDVDTDERAWYFKQVQFGVYARMALIIAVLGLSDMLTEDYKYVRTAPEFQNPNLPKGA